MQFACANTEKSEKTKVLVPILVCFYMDIRVFFQSQILFILRFCSFSLPPVATQSRVLPEKNLWLFPKFVSTSSSQLVSPHLPNTHFF